MTSPFPGMDPYLEGYLWPDFHHDLATAIKIQLAPQISPKYVARIELYTVEDTSPDRDVGIMYPDVEILKRKANKVKTELNKILCHSCRYWDRAKVQMMQITL